MVAITIQNVLYSFGTTRQPKARQKILDAARRIVESQGAGHLTFDELAVESGVTRGGITYHFPTKEALLKGLIEVDIADWERAAHETVPELGCRKTAVILGHLRCNLDSEDLQHRRFVSGMLSAAMIDPSLLDPVREHQRRTFDGWDWSDTDLMRYVILMASEGMFWQSMFDMNPLPPSVHQRVVTLIRSLAENPCAMPKNA